MSSIPLLQTPSDEQQCVINFLKQGKHVVVDACAGSGKSTTVLSAARAMPHRRFLQLTYNSMLRLEVKKKIEELGLSNIEVHTYHSLAVRHYMETAHTDTGIRYVLYHAKPFSSMPRPVDVLVIDEAQDMSFLYYELVKKFLYDLYHCCDDQEQLQLLVMGDYMQGLYEFKGSDIRFLTMADKFWLPSRHAALVPSVFEKCTLKMSYRITRSMADFVNHVMLGETRLLAERDGDPVVYLRNTQYNNERAVIYYVTRLLDSGVLPSDIFVLGASVKGANSNIRKIENVLVDRNIPCYVPMSDQQDKIDDRVIDGKIVFSTFHAVKGRQRKYVFVVGFDNNYMKYHARHEPDDRCPNTLYVGATRATHRLFLLETNDWPTDRPLSFLRMSHHEMRSQPYIEFKGIPQTVFYEERVAVPVPGGGGSAATRRKEVVRPTDLIKFVNESVVEFVSPILDRVFVVEVAAIAENAIDVPTVVHTRRGFYEDISDLNGIAIPAMYSDRLLQRSLLHQMILEEVRGFRPGKHGYLRGIVDSDVTGRAPCSVSDYMFLANVYLATTEKLYFKLRQIDRDEYGWMSDETMERCYARLSSTVGTDNTTPGAPILVEQSIVDPSMDFAHRYVDARLRELLPEAGLINFRFAARVDFITEHTVWEIKCTTKLTIDHLLQVAIYAWLWRVVVEFDMPLTDLIRQQKQFRLLNVRTGEILRLEATTSELETIVVSLMRGKYLRHERLDDNMFLDQFIPNN